MHILENDTLQITVNTIGAELSKITSVKNKMEYMWDGNSEVWGHFAPNLFPIIGALKNDTYIFENKSYKLPKHGLIRNNKTIALHEKSKNSLTFKFNYSEETLEKYPFKFEFFITYTLINNCIEVLYTVKNLDDKILYFSLGGHPAFKCPVFENEIYEDYSLHFEHIENSKTHLINMENGLILDKTKPIFNNNNILPLKHDLFNADAIIFKDLKSKKVTLNSKNHGDILSVSYQNFPYLGIWAKPEGDYVCIEPWLGIADNENTNQDFKTKEGILRLNVGNTFKATYTIEIH